MDGNLVVVSVILGGSVLLLVLLLRLIRGDRKAAKIAPNVAQGERRRSATETNRGQQRNVVAKKKTAPRVNNARGAASGAGAQSFRHAWLNNTFKGHTGQVLNMDLSANGKYLASSADDRTVLLWDVKDLAQKDHRSLRVNIEYDHGLFIKWSPDTKAFIIYKCNESAIEVYKVEKKKDGWLGSATKALTFPRAYEEDDVVGFDIASTGKFMMTCSNKTDLIVWDLKGQILTRVDTYLMSTCGAKISPCGRFIVACGFAPDAKVWEVKFAKNGDFQEVKRVFELTGHSSGVYDVAFDVDSSHMATVSKDATWRLFNTNVEYQKGEDPKLIMTGAYELTAAHALIALSPDAEVVVIATYNALNFFSTATGKLDCVIGDVFDDRIAAVTFDASGKYVLAAGGRHIRVFHNVTGYKATVASCKSKLKQTQTSATKERLEKLIKDSEAFLNTIETKC